MKAPRAGVSRLAPSSGPASRSPPCRATVGGRCELHPSAAAGLPTEPAKGGEARAGPAVRAGQGGPAGAPQGAGCRPTHPARVPAPRPGAGRTGFTRCGACGPPEDNGRSLLRPQRHPRHVASARGCVQLPPHKERTLDARFKEGPECKFQP